jgi:heptaprenyl diphosphate synthase
LGSFCFFLSTLEYLIPKPLPFMRIGLANLPLILALDLFSPGPFALLGLIKITGQALITGTLFSYVFLFSLAGTSVSALVMYGLRRFLGKNRIGFIGLGVCGAVFSNLLQLALARFFVFGEGVRFLAPLFLASGLISGGGLGFFCEAFAARSRWYCRALGEDPGGAVSPAGTGADGLGGTGGLGFFCEAFAARSRWYRRALREDPGGAVSPAGTGADGLGRAGVGGADSAEKDRRGADRKREEARRRERWNRLFRSGDLFIAGLFFMLIFLCTPSLVFKTLQFLLFWLLARLAGKRGRPLTAILLTAGIVFFNLLVPYGRVLVQFGPLTVTQGALLAGLRRALTLEGLVTLSGVFIRADLRLPGAFGDLLGESFRIFAVLEERKAVFTPGRIIEGIDDLMLELDRGEAGGGVYGPPSVPAQRHPAALPLLAAMALLTVLLALADERAVLEGVNRLLRPDPGQARAGFLIIGVQPEGPLIGLDGRTFITGGLPDRGEPVPPEGKPRFKAHRGGVGNIRMAVLLPQPENFTDKKIGHRNPLSLGQGVGVSLHKT